MGGVRSIVAAEGSREERRGVETWFLQRLQTNVFFSLPEVSMLDCATCSTRLLAVTASCILGCRHDPSQAISAISAHLKRLFLVETQSHAAVEHDVQGKAK